MITVLRLMINFITTRHWPARAAAGPGYGQDYNFMYYTGCPKRNETKIKHTLMNYIFS